MAKQLGTGDSQICRGTKKEPKSARTPFRPHSHHTALTLPPYECCAQQTGVHRMVGSNRLIYLPTRGEEDVYMYIRPVLLPEAVLPPEGTLPPRTCLAEPVRTGE